MADFSKAALDAIRAVWLTESVHAVGKVPKLPVTPYLVGSVSTGSTENYRLSGDHGSRSYRIALQAIGKTDDEVKFAVDKAEDALLDKSLIVAGFDCTPCQPEVSSQPIRDPDGGVLLSCTLTYTFTAFPKE